MKAHVLLCLAALFLWGCSEAPIKQSNWSNELPPENLFVENYDRDARNAGLQPLAEYLTWIKRFYQGWELYPTGWHLIARDLTAKIADPALQADVEFELRQLGVAIAGEWAKDNAARRITSRHIAIWGNALQKSAERAETLDMLTRIKEDVDNLLNGRISADVITENRFYAAEDVLEEVH